MITCLPTRVGRQSCQDPVWPYEKTWHSMDVHPESLNQSGDEFFTGLYEVLSIRVVQKILLKGQGFILSWRSLQTSYMGLLSAKRMDV